MLVGIDVCHKGK
jgi:hypothetical protein